MSLLFLVNGFLIGSWAAKIPLFADRLQLSESIVGIMIVIFGFGSLVTMPATGVVIARFGTAFVNKALSLLAATTLLWVTLSPNLWTAGLAMFFFGGMIGSMDLAMNALAVEIERKRPSPIMSSCHGFWSLGGLIGAILGGYLLEFSSLNIHAFVVTALCLLLVVMALPQIKSSGSAKPTERAKVQFPRTLLPYLIGVVALCSAMPEGAVIDWSALYLRQELASSTFVSTFAFGAFSATMAVMRFLGDPVRSKYGAVRTVRACALLASAGLLIAGLASTGMIAILGFLIAGIGMSNLVPIAFSAAGNVPGLAPGISLSLTTTIGYSGVLVAPALFGYLAEIFSFSTVFTALAAALLLVFVFSNVVAFADSDQAVD